MEQAHNLDKTIDLLNPNIDTSGFSENDTIHTTDYCTEGDGNGADFLVRAINPDEAADNIMTYNIPNTTLIAEIIPGEGGSIRLAQVGELPTNTLPVSPITAQTMSAYYDSSVPDPLPQNDFDIPYIRNTEVLTTVCNHPDVHKVILTPNAIYGVLYFSIMQKEDLTIVGNGATIVQAQSSVLSLIQIMLSSGIRLENLNLIKGVGQSGAAAVYSYRSDNLGFKHVRIQSLCSGFHFTGSSSYTPTVNMHKAQIQAGVSGIIGEYLSWGSFDMLYIDAVSKGIELNSNSQNIRLWNTTICNALTGFSLYSTSLCEIWHMVLQNTSTAIELSNTSQTYLSSIHATGITKAFKSTNGSTVRVSDSVFVAADGSLTDTIFADPVGNETISMHNCVFDFYTNWFTVSSSTTQNKAKLAFTNCHFNLRTPKTTAPYGAKILGGRVDATFSDCSFHVDSFPLNEGSLYPNTAMFYFEITSNANLTHYWHFDSCRFSHDTVNDTVRVAANSPFLIHADKDESYQKTFLTLRDCVLHRFWWTVRFYADNSQYNIDPASSGLPDSTAITAAVTALNAKERYLSKDNLLYFDTPVPDANGAYYIAAADFGLSN